MIFCLSLLSLCWLSGVRQVLGQGDSTDEQTDGQVVRDDEIALKRLSPLEMGMQPFYRMTNVFLGLVQNKDVETGSLIYQQVQSLIQPAAVGLCPSESSTSSSNTGNEDPNNFDLKCKYILGIPCIMTSK